MTLIRPYLFVDHVILFNTVHVLLVLLFSLEEVGLVIVAVFGKSETEGFMELSVLSDSELGRGKGARHTGGEGNGEELQRGHGESFYLDAKENMMTIVPRRRVEGVDGPQH
jgi:hypothetical protein